MDPQNLIRRPPPLPAALDRNERNLTFAQKAADIIAQTVGSWRFIILQSTGLLTWVLLNLSPWVPHWDPYPFIALNLVLSLQAAYTGPMVMMSQNRQAVRDRETLNNDYEIDRLAEHEIREVLSEIQSQRLELQEQRKIIEQLREDLLLRRS